MKKIGPIIVVISSLFTLGIGTVCLLLLYKVINMGELPSFSQKFIAEKLLSQEGHFKEMYIASIAIALLQMLLATFTLNKRRGISSFIILLIISSQISFAIYNGIKLDAFAISNIINLSIIGLAWVSIFIGFIKGNGEKNKKEKIKKEKNKKLNNVS